jgi:hypothetical protein
MMLELFVYLDYSNRWATIHSAGCAHARGHVNADTKKPKWFGPFSTEEAAIACASNADHRFITQGCKKCKPHLPQTDRAAIAP